MSLVRSLVSAEGEHSRGSYILHTGYAPLHPAPLTDLGSLPER